MAYFGAPKVPKKQQIETNNYTIHRISDLDENQRVFRWTQDYYQIASIDPGIENLAIRIERRYKDGRILPLYYDRVKLSEPQDPDPMSRIYFNCTQFLKTLQPYFLECHLIVMERQLPINYRCIRISQHMVSYFVLTLADSPLMPLMIEIDNKSKGRALNIPRGLNKLQYKDWLIEKATELLQMRQDQAGLDKLLNERSNSKKKKKQDDLADTVCQAEALCVLFKLPLTVKIETQPEIVKLVIPRKN